MSASHAKEYGLIDEVLPPRKKGDPEAGTGSSGPSNTKDKR
jgi:hypothetical protein